MQADISDIIFVSLEDWDDVWRRNQFLCAGLARRFPEMRILFVGLPRNVSHGLRRGDLSVLRAAATGAVPEYPNIHLLHPLKLFPNTLALGRRLNEEIARRQIKQAAARLGLVEPILWLNPHSAVHLAGRMGESAVVYDITDDWISLTQKGWLRRLTAAQDKDLCQKADAVIVCSPKLFAMKQPFTKNQHLIANGVDAQHYARVQDNALPLPEAARQWPKPVLGYTGTIHPDRVDVGLVEALARKFPAGTVALVGPNLLSAPDAARLSSLGNVQMTGPVPYAEIPSYMRAFDVCLTPHRMTAFTESLNPIKLWEYLAGGKPIVSTDVAGFRDFPQLVRLAATEADFLQAAEDALAEGRAKQSARQAEARAHSWETHLDAVEAVLRQCRNAEAPPSRI